MSNYLDMPVPLDIAETLRTSREASGLTQQQLAKALGLQRQTISNYETGQQIPKIDVFLKIARVIKLSEAQLDGFHFSSRPREQEVAKEQLCLDFGVEHKIACQSVAITATRERIVLRIDRAKAS